MGLPKYPLQTILDQRNRAKEDAKKNFATSIQALDAEPQRLSQLESEKDAMIASRADWQLPLYDTDEKGLLSVPLVDARRNGIQHLTYQIEEKAKNLVLQEKAVKTAEQVVESRKTALVEADKELKAIEKHHENWLADVKKEAAKKEQKLGEEIALARFVRDAAEQAEEEDSEA